MDPVQNQFSSGDTQQPPNPVQPVTPVQSAQPVQQAQPIQSVVQPVSQPVQSLPQMMARPLQQPVASMQMVQPVQTTSMGTGDIVLSSTGNKRDRKKVFAIVAAVVFCIAAVVLLVFSLKEGMGGDEITASNTREAYNMYVNYFLTGEVSKEDVSISEIDEEEEEEEEETFFETNDEVDNNEVTGEEIVDGAVDSGTTEAGSEEVSGGSINYGIDNTYFGSMIDYRGEESDKYLSNLRDYYNVFLDFYSNDVNEESDEEDIVTEELELLNNYKTWLDFVVTYYSGEGLSGFTILEAYENGGVDGAESFINNEAIKFEDFGEIDGESFSNLMRGYGEQELKLIKNYDSIGCIANDGTIDFGCVSGKSSEDRNKVIEAKSKYDLEIQGIVGDYTKDLNLYLFYFNNVMEGEEE